MKHLELYKRELQARGLRATNQRTALLAVLKHAKKPLSVEDIAAHAEVAMNITTAYRILEQLKEKGLVRQVFLGTHGTYFERADSHHHHLICVSCARMEDVEACLPKDAFKKVLASSRFFKRMTEHSVEFFGVCTSCAKV